MLFDADPCNTTGGQGSCCTEGSSEVRAERRREGGRGEGGGRGEVGGRGEGGREREGEEREGGREEEAVVLRVAVK